MSKKKDGLRYLAGVLVLLFLAVDVASANHCYILRKVTKTNTLITLEFRSVFQGPTPRVPPGFSIVGAWYRNQTPRKLTPQTCREMVAYKAKNDVHLFPLSPRCLRSYSDGVLVFTSRSCTEKRRR
jgi:hypothetical protein